jgi:hypothetical protein
MTRALLLGVGLMSGLAAISACSAGQVTQTDTQVASVPGVSANSPDGKIAIRNAVVAYAPKYLPNSTIPLDLRLFNNSGAEVRLTGATTDNGRVVLFGGPTASSSPSPSPSVSASKKANGSPSPSPSSSPSPTSAASTTINLLVPPDGPQVLAPGTGSTYLAIVGRTADLLAGGSTSVTLTFTYADGSTTAISLDVPVGTPLSPPPRVSASE